MVAHGGHRHNRRMPATTPSVCSTASSSWTRRRWLAVVCAAALSWLDAAATTLPPAAPPDRDIAVRVQKAGADIIVDVDCPVHAPIPTVWEVLTDYDKMASFISSLKLSVVQTRTDGVLTVRQLGKVDRGPFSFAFDNVREIELVPLVEIRSKLISGDLKASSFTTRIADVDGVVHIVHSGRYTPNVWVPPIVGPSLIEGETRKQYAEIRAEILRRASRAAASL